MAMSSKAFSSRSAMRFDRRTRVACLAALATLAAGCDNNSLNKDETTFHMRALNLVEDSPSLAVDLEDTTVHNVTYGGGSGFSAAGGGTPP